MSWRDDIITVPELAERLGVCVKTVERRIRSRKVPATKLFGMYLIPTSAFLKLLERDALANVDQPDADPEFRL